MFNNAKFKILSINLLTTFYFHKFYSVIAELKSEKKRNRCFIPTTTRCKFKAQATADDDPASITLDQ